MFVLQLFILLGGGGIVQGQKSSSTTFIVDSLNEAAFKTKSQNLSGALSNLHKAQNLAIQSGYKKGEAISNFYEAEIYDWQGFVSHAIPDYLKARALFKELKMNGFIALIDQKIAGGLVKEGRIDSALKIYNLLWSALKKNNDQKGLADVKSCIGQIQLIKGKSAEAFKLFNEALLMSKAARYQKGIMAAFYGLGLAEKSNSHFLKAETYLLESIKTGNGSAAVENVYLMIQSRLALLDIYLQRRQYQQAEQAGMSAFKMVKNIEAVDLFYAVNAKMVQLYNSQGNQAKLISWQDSAFQVLNRHRKRENEFSANFIEVIKNQHDYRLATENAIVRAERVSDEQVLIISAGTFILIVMAVLVMMVFINFQKQKQFGRELRAKNVLIEAQVTELGALNEEISEQNILLEADNKTKDKLLSIISHDLRSPLVNTKGILNLVNQGIVPEDQAKQLLLQLETQYMGTTSLLDNLLFWLKGQMSGKNLDKINMPVFPIVKGLEDEHRMLLDRKQILINNEIDPKFTITADKEMIRIVLRNLISNAIKFTPEKGVIRVFASADNTETRISIQDSGIGMTPETIQRVNAKQYYTTAGTALEKGSGFGLMLCCDLISRHSGQLKIESEPNHGSVFTILLPIVTAV